MRRALPSLFVDVPSDKAKIEQAGDDTVISGTFSSIRNDDLECVEPGKYYAVVFINGALVRDLVVDFQANAMKAFRSRELGLTLCIPPTWDAFTGANNGVSWESDLPMRRFYSKSDDGKMIYQAAVFAFARPPSMPDQDSERYFLRRAINIIAAGAPEADVERVATEALPFESVKDASCAVNPNKSRLPIYRVVRGPPRSNKIYVGILTDLAADASGCAALESMDSYFEWSN